MKKVIILLFGLISYMVFFVAFLYAIGFVGNIWVPKGIDSGVAGENPMLINVLLLSVFAIQHSVMARPGFKKWWANFVSPAAERSMYVLLSSLALMLIYWKWQPMTEKVWNIEGETYVLIIQAIFWIGWLVVLISTFLINHFHLFGLQQVYQNFKNQTLSSPRFRKNLFYKLVRHPIMLGFVIAFWAEPEMTQGHLLFAVVTTVYMFTAVKFLEERDLIEMHGDTYKDYKQSTSMIIPFTNFKKK